MDHSHETCERRKFSSVVMRLEVLNLSMIGVLHLRISHTTCIDALTKRLETGLAGVPVTNAILSFFPSSN